MSYDEPSPWPRRLGISLLVAGSAFFSFLNASERVTLDFGFFSLYRISLVGLVFCVFLLGMLTMFLFSLRHDRKIRGLLEDRYSAPTRTETAVIVENPEADPYM